MSPVSDQLEKDLTAVLHARATATAIPPAPIDRLVREGERAAAVRRRRTGILAAVAAAAAVVAVAVPVGVRLGGDSAPSPTNPSPTNPSPTHPIESRRALVSLDGLPQGEAPKVPYLQAGALHVGDRTVPTSGDSVVSAGDSVLVSTWHRDVTSWSVLTDRGLLEAGYLKNIQSHQVSPDGTMAVTISWPDRTHTVLTAVDPATGAALGSPLTLDAAYAACCGGGQEVAVDGIDDAGTVYFSDRHGVSAWRPGHGAPVRLGNVSAMAATPLGLLEQAARGSGRIIRFDARSGRFVQGPDLPVDQQFAMSTDGSLIAYGIEGQLAGKLGGKTTPLTVRDVATGREMRLALPPVAQAASPVAFEGDTAVLLEVRVPGTAPVVHRHLLVVRCAVSDGTCELAADLGPGNREDGIAGLRY